MGFEKPWQLGTSPVSDLSHAWAPTGASIHSLWFPVTPVTCGTREGQVPHSKLFSQSVSQLSLTLSNFSVGQIQKQ